MTTARIIEGAILFLIAFLVIASVSFLSLRPHLKAVRAEASAQWEGLKKDVANRNEILPGLIESLRSFESGHGNLAYKLLEARAVSMRVSNPDRFVEAVDEIDSCLAQIEKLARTKPNLTAYPPFADSWRRVAYASGRLEMRRTIYNKNVELYNRLLSTFPQNLLAGVFGFVPLSEYPLIESIDHGQR